MLFSLHLAERLWETDPNPRPIANNKQSKKREFLPCLPKPTGKGNYGYPNIFYPTATFRGEEDGILAQSRQVGA